MAPAADLGPRSAGFALTKVNRSDMLNRKSERCHVEINDASSQNSDNRGDDDSEMRCSTIQTIESESSQAGTSDGPAATPAAELGPRS